MTNVGTQIPNADLASKVMEAFIKVKNLRRPTAQLSHLRVISSTEYNQKLASTPPATSANSATTKPSKNSLFNLISKAQKN